MFFNVLLIKYFLHKFSVFFISDVCDDLVF